MSYLQELSEEQFEELVLGAQELWELAVSIFC